MNLVAVLIVRDEAANLPGCLSSLGGVVDGVHVHDTGSADDSAAIARSLGATVSAGQWTGDFAAARNAAVEAAGRPEWVLSIDADERPVATPRRLRAALDAAAADASTAFSAFTVELDNRHDELPYTHRSTRLFRPAALRWTGRVHERLVPDGDRPALPREALHLIHLGYEDAQARRRKADRNAGLAEAALREDRPDRAVLLLDLGRSYVGAGRLQDAVDTFERLREEAPGTREWVLGTDALARLLLGAGHDQAVVVLARQLRLEGVGAQYCAWLEAQALAQLGHAEDAWRLLRTVDEVVDPAGRIYPPQHLAQLKSLMAELMG